MENYVQKKAFYSPLLVHFITASTRVINYATSYSTSPLLGQLYFPRFSPCKVIYELIICQLTGDPMIYAYY